MTLQQQILFHQPTTVGLNTSFTLLFRSIPSVPGPIQTAIRMRKNSQYCIRMMHLRLILPQSLVPLLLLLLTIVSLSTTTRPPSHASAFTAQPDLHFHSSPSRRTTTATTIAATTTVEPPPSRVERDTTTTKRHTDRRRDDDMEEHDNDDNHNYNDLEYLIDSAESREMDDPFHIILLGSTFQKPKITVSYCATSLEYVLSLPPAEALEQSQFAQEQGLSCLGTWPREECLVLGRQLQRRDLECRVVPFVEGGQRGWQAKDASSAASDAFSASSGSD